MKPISLKNFFWIFLTCVLSADAIQKCDDILSYRKNDCQYEVLLQLKNDYTNQYLLVVNATKTNIDNKSLGALVANYNELRHGTVPHIKYILTYPECNYFPLIYRVALNGIEYCNDRPAENKCDISVVSWYYKPTPTIIKTKEEHYTENIKDRSTPTDSESEICGTTTNIMPIVVKGNTVYEGEFPWVAAIFNFNDASNDYSLLCNGNLISSKHILTAQSCIGPDFDLVVALGKASLFNWAAYGRVLQVDKISYISNLAILTMAYPVTFNDKIRPICLWQNNLSQGTNENKIIGWGRQYSKIGQFRMNVVPNVACANNEKYSDIFCAAQAENPNRCAGYNGDGFVTKNAGKYYLRGVVINANVCARNTMLIDISKHNEWIRKKMME